MKRKLLVAVLSVSACCFALGFSVSAKQTNAEKTSGGWSESEGYYVSGEYEGADEYISGTDSVTSIRLDANSKKPTKKPNKHTGERLTYIDKDGICSYASHGETVWYHKYHYTNARMELSDGTVKTTSGRQWGTGATEATSPYYCPGVFENTEARTYWGS